MRRLLQHHRRDLCCDRCGAGGVVGHGIIKDSTFEMKRLKHALVILVRILLVKNPNHSDLAIPTCRKVDRPAT